MPASVPSLLQSSNSETTPLLSSSASGSQQRIKQTNDTTAPIPEDQQATRPPTTRKWPKSVLYRGLLAGFFVSLSFGVTQVPLFYVFRLMTCEAYYITHPEPTPPSNGDAHFDRCSVRAIEASTASSVAILGASTTIFGLMNLFLTGWTIRSYGIKTALAIQVFWPAARLLVQNIGVAYGGFKGILIIQLSQIITIIGGPVGYLLALNSFIIEVVENSERTGALGRLQGAAMLGTAVGYLAGGLISKRYGIAMPFKVTLVLFLLSTVYVLVFLPGVPLPEQKKIATDGDSTVAEGTKNNTQSLPHRLFGSLKILAPQRYVLSSGRVKTEYGALILAFGTFFGVLATGYLPVLLQLYSTDVLGFGTAENSYLVAMHSSLRGLFLTLAFPRIIKLGRKILTKREERNLQAENNQSSGLASEVVAITTDDIKQIATRPGTSQDSSNIEPNKVLKKMKSISSQDDHIPLPEPVTEAEEPTLPPTPPTPKNAPSPSTEITEPTNPFAFDLIFTRYSLISDGILTGLATFIRQGWQIYAIAAILPIAGGTGAAAKGTILQMCAPERRTEALQAMTLVDMVARLSNTFLFGIVFAAFANIGRTNLTFAVNAGIALLGFFVLLFSRFPARGSKRLEVGDEGQIGYIMPT